MNQTQTLHNVSAFYFFVLAFIYAAAAMFFRNDLSVEVMTVVLRILDVPFAFVALLYGGSTLSLQLTEGKEEEDSTSPWVMVIYAVAILLFGLVVFVNFAFPSQL